MIENREMAAFAKALWENYIKFRNKEADVSNVSYYKAKVTAKPGGGVLTIKRPFDTTAYNVSAPSYMDDIEIGGQVLVLRFGNDNNLKNHFIIDNAARTMLASAIATGSSITFPISIANGGTGATTLAGAKSNLGVPNASDTNPNMDGTATPGTQTTYSRGDHTHPADTTKADKATTVTNVAYDSTTGNITQTINGTTSNVTPVVTSVNLNGTDTATPSFYAPTTAGTSGYVLTSNGSGAPTWQAVSGGSSAAYAVCNTQDDYALTATITSSGTFELTTGANVFVSFTYARPMYPESSNLTLNVNSTGDKTIRFANTSLDSTETVSPITWTAGEVVEFVYDGTYWQMVGKYKAASTTSYGVTLLSSAVNSTDMGTAATSAAVKAAYDLANSRSYALSMSSNVITLTGQDGNVSSVTLPVWDGSYT